MRKDRLITIKEIIHKYNVGSQDEILGYLDDHGIEITQATLSRDLKTLRIAKIPDENGGYKYSLPRQDPLLNKVTGSNQIHGVISIEFSGNIGVIKTLSGYASSVSLLIDEQDFTEVAGTVAGDDTIIMILKDSIRKGEFKKKLFLKFPEIKEII